MYATVNSLVFRNFSLCNAYLGAGRGGDFLQMLQNDLDSARPGGPEIEVRCFAVLNERLIRVTMTFDVTHLS